MQQFKTIAIFIAIALLAGIGGFLANQHYIQSRSETAPTDSVTKNTARSQVTSAVAGNPRPDFILQDLDNASRSAAEFDGQVVLVNFWATWCPPCVKEMPALNNLYQDYKDRGFTILGIALDTRDDVEQFVDPIGIGYPILLGEEAGLDLSLQFGNRLGVLPFTAFVGRDGKIAITHPGELRYEDAQAYLMELL